MITIKLKFTVEEYKTILTLTEFSYKQLHIYDFAELFKYEHLENISNKLNKSRFSTQHYHTLSLSLSEAIVFFNVVGKMMEVSGIYEAAILHNIISEFDRQINRQIQLRMNVNYK